MRVHSCCRLLPFSDSSIEPPALPIHSPSSQMRALSSARPYSTGPRLGSTISADELDQWVAVNRQNQPQSTQHPHVHPRWHSASPQFANLRPWYADKLTCRGRVATLPASSFGRRILTASSSGRSPALGLIAPFALNPTLPPFALRVRSCGQYYFCAARGTGKNAGANSGSPPREAISDQSKG